MTEADLFALPPERAAKDRPVLLTADRAHFRAMQAAIQTSLAGLTEQLETTRALPARPGQELLERDLETHRLAGQLRMLRRYSVDLCLGRMTPADGSPPVYVGRVGLKDPDGVQLLVDWRTPAAAPFFAATMADPMGLSSRRRYRWRDGRVIDYWDETLTPGRKDPTVALDEDSALLAGLTTARTPRMQDVLSTIAADQDAIVRADPRQPLLVDGGPGTGKTVVALHRAAYLVYTDPRLNRRGSNILFLGPHQPYLSYIADVLPSLGEDNVHTATLADLVPESATALPEPDPRVAALKHSTGLVNAIEPAVALYEEPPTTPLDLDTPWGGTRLTARDWAAAFAAVAPGTPHNEAREQIWDELAEILTPRLGDPDNGPDTHDVHDALQRDADLTDTLHRAWPLLNPTDVVADLWEVPAYLGRCAPTLSAEQRALLRRDDPRAFTDADLPLLDTARHRLGDPDLERRRRQRRLHQAADAREMDAVVEHLIATDDSEMQVMSMLRRPDLRTALDTHSIDIDPAGAVTLAGPYAHIVIDEAQELTDAQWAMILRRCPSRSLTIVGDRAQARHGFTRTWQDRLAGVGLDRVRHATLTLNYRTPAEVMATAEPVIRAVMPDANVPTSLRHSGLPVRHALASQAQQIVDDWLATHPQGVGVIITPEGTATALVGPHPRLQHLNPVTAKGLEFDLVLLAQPADPSDGLTAAVDRYVAMTRTTSQLVILTTL